MSGFFSPAAEKMSTISSETSAFDLPDRMIKQFGRFAVVRDVLLVDRGLAGAAAFGVGRERLLQLVGEPQVVHDEAAGLVLEDAVDPCDGLHEAVAAHRLVHVHRREAGCVESREPHVTHDDDAERVRGVAKAGGELLAPRLVADVRLPVEWVRRRARYHHLEGSVLVVIRVPLRPQRDEFVVQLHYDPAAHHHDHGLAVHRLAAPLVVLDEVARDAL